MPNKTIIYNDNNACVCWSHNMTTKGLCQIQIRENGIREMVQKNLIEVQHISGKINLADLFSQKKIKMWNILSQSVVYYYNQNQV